MRYGPAILAVSLFAALSFPAPALALTDLGERWYVRVSGIDDAGYVLVNGRRVMHTVQYRGDSGWRDVTGFVRTTQGETRLLFRCFDGGGTASWRFEVGRSFPGEGRQVVWSEARTLTGQPSANPFRKVREVALNLGGLVGDRFGYPLPGVTGSVYSRGYGVYGWGGKSSYHTGCDIGTSAGAYSGLPVMSSADGKVVWNDWVNGWGWVIVVEHDVPATGRIHTQYAHLVARALPALESTVTRGQVIGYVGSTGLSSAPHLHFEAKRPYAGDTGWVFGRGQTNIHPDRCAPRYFDPYRVISGY